MRSPFPKISLSLVIIIPFVLLIGGTVGFVSYLSYRSGQESVDHLADKYHTELNSRVVQKTSAYLQTLDRVNKNNIRDLRRGLWSFDNFDSQERQALEQTQLNSLRGAVIGFGAASGGHRSLESLKDGTFEIRAAPNGGGLFEKYLIAPDGSKAKATQTSVYVDSRERPWFRAAIAAKKPAWTKSFACVFTRELLIALAEPIYDLKTNEFLGVTYGSRSLEELSYFLRSIDLKSGAAFIMEADGTLIATSTSEKPYQILLNDPNEEQRKFEQKLVKASDSSSKLISQSAKVIRERINDRTSNLNENLNERNSLVDLEKIDKSEKFDIDVNGDRHLVYVSTYKDLTGLDWSIVTVLSEYDFMEEINVNRTYLSFLYGFGLFASVAIGLWISRRITQSLVFLTKSTQVFSKNGIEQSPSVFHIVEVETLAESFRIMMARLQEADRFRNNYERDLVSQVTEKTAALRDSEVKLNDILNNAAATIARLFVYSDRTLEQDYVSNDCSTICGFSSEELKADPSLWVSLIVPEDLQAVESQIYANIFSETTGNYIYRLRHKDGNLRWISQTNHSRWDEAHKAWIVTIVSIDISDRKQAEELLQKSESDLIEAQAIAHIGNWAFDIQSEKITWSKELFYMFGLDPNQPEPIFANYLQRIHPDDRALMQQCIEQARINGKTYKIDYRAIQPDGSIHYHEGRGEVERNEQGQVVRLFGTNLDITDRKQVEIELAKAKEVAEAATRAKGEFLANMSHEIRTPMNGVIGMTELLRTTSLDEEQQGFVKTIKESGDALLTVINDILDFSKTESGMLEIEARDFDLRESVSAVCKLLENQANNKQINLQYTIASDVPTNVIGDRNRLRQILLNLIGNAIKFTHAGGVDISITGQALPESNKYQLKFAIADTGIGIRGDRIGKLFQPFTQADSSTSRKYGGTGLGLTISKRLVELMRGTIWVESCGQVGGDAPKDWQSESKTQGSTFHFAIAVSTNIAIAPQRKLKEESQTRQTPTYPQIAVEFPLKILLVEDNQFNQMVAIAMLKRLGYQIDNVANNGLEALQAMENQSFDLVFMDIQMPEMDGLTATKIIRTKLMSQVKIVAMTANVNPEDRQACLDAGMDDFISKPIDIQEIIRVISSISR